MTDDEKVEEEENEDTGEDLETDSEKATTTPADEGPLCPRCEKRLGWKTSWRGKSKYGQLSDEKVNIAYFRTLALLYCRECGHVLGGGNWQF